MTSVIPGTPGSDNAEAGRSTPGLGASNLGGYRILRGTLADISLSIHAQIAAPPYTDPYAVPSTTYYYEVESYELGNHVWQ